MATLDDIFSYARTCDVASLVTDDAIHTVFVNKAFTELCGYPSAELMGHNPGELLRGARSSELSRQLFRRGISDLVPFHVSVRNYRKSTGEEYLAGVYVVPFRDEADQEKHYYIALERELQSPGEDLLSDGLFSKTLSGVLDLVTPED